MTDGEFPVWWVGRDDDLIRRHLGADRLPAFGPVLTAAPAPVAEEPPAVAGVTPWTVTGKGAVEVYKLGGELREFGEAAWRFTLGPDGGLARYTRNYTPGGRGWDRWNWKSVTFDGGREFREALHTPMRVDGEVVKFHRKTMAATSAEAQHLKLGVFTAKGLWKAAKKDARWAAVGIGAEATWKVYEGFRDGEGFEPVRTYLTDPARMLDLAKAVVSGAAGTAAAVFAAGLVSVAIVPFAVGLVVGVAVGCGLDYLTDGDSLCQAAGRFLFDEPPTAPPLPPEPPVLRPGPILP